MEKQLDDLYLRLVRDTQVSRSVVEGINETGQLKEQPGPSLSEEEIAKNVVIKAYSRKAPNTPEAPTIIHLKSQTYESSDGMGIQTVITNDDLIKESTFNDMRSFNDPSCADDRIDLVNNHETDDSIDPVSTVAVEASPNEPVEELLKVILNLPRGDQVRFIKLFVLQLNDSMLSLLKRLVNTLQEEKIIIEEKAMVKTEEYLNTRDVKGFEVEEALNVNYLVQDTRNKVSDAAEEKFFDPSEVNFRNLKVELQKLPIVINEGIVPAKLPQPDTTASPGDIAENLVKTKRNRKRPWRFDDEWPKSDPTKPRPYLCNECPSSFFTTKALKKHSLTHLPNSARPYQCQKCGLRFRDSCVLNEHQASHGDERKHLCKDCGKTFKFSSCLYRHMQTRHALDLPHECDKCPQKFATSVQLKRHKWGLRCSGLSDSEVTEKTNRPVKKRIRRPATMGTTKQIRRPATMGTTKPIRRSYDVVQCDVCGKSLTRGNLKDHVATFHSTERPYSCSTCQQSFGTKKILYYHSQSHIKSIQCEMCSKFFSKTRELSAHKISIHTGEKPFACAICPKKFNKKYNFDGHMRLHKGEKPYSCDQCGKTFTFRHYIKKHKAKMHGEMEEVTVDNLSEKARPILAPSSFVF